MAEPTRRRWISDIESVRYIAIPAGRERANPPSLGDLRAFVQACDGLPDSAHVAIEPGSLDEGGRRDVVFSVRIVKEKEVTDA